MTSRFNLLLIALLLASCSTETSDTGSDSWTCEFCHNTEIHQTTTGFWFNFPSKDGVHYVTKNLSGEKSVEASVVVDKSRTTTDTVGKSTPSAQTISARKESDATCPNNRQSAMNSLPKDANLSGSNVALTVPSAGATANFRSAVAESGLAVGKLAQNKTTDAGSNPAPLTISMTFRIEGAGKFTAAGGGTPQVRLFIQRKGDRPWEVDCKSQSKYEFYRWWSNPKSVVLKNGTFTLSVPLDPNEWSSVCGKFGRGGENFTYFNEAKSDIAVTGLTFGDQYGFGHGVWGSGKFTLTKFVIQ